MVTTIKVLKRKDASSVVVAVVTALILSQLLSVLTSDVSGKILGLNEGEYIAYAAPNADWIAQYAHPVVYATLQLLLLEVILWLYGAVKAAVSK